MHEHQPDKGERVQLVETIEETLRHPLSPPLRQAFLTVPRAHFVRVCYTQEQPGVWVEQDATRMVYQDSALVTKIDAAGHPGSSSSKPSIMAAMLEALSVEPGSRVLEIGTGTGYNAALLAELVGPNGHVVSVDIDAALVDLASTRLRAAGACQVQAVVANGLEGYAPTQPYDRIIVTAGAASVPPSWITQLVEGGILVGNLLRPLATPLYRLVKEADGSMYGSLLATRAFFMTLHASSPAFPPRVPFTRFETLPCVEQGHTDLRMVNALYEESFGLFLDRPFPQLERHLRPLGGSPPAIAICLLWKETLLTLSPLDTVEGRTAIHWAVEVRGEVPLWSLIQSCYEQWMDQGQPPVDRYTLHVRPEGSFSLHLRPHGQDAMHQEYAR